MPDSLRPSVARVGSSMAKLTFPKSVTPSCAKPFTCLPPSLGVGVSPSSLGSPFWKAASSMTSLSAAPSCASSSTSPSVCSNIKNLLTLCSSLLLKPFDFQDRIYRASLGKCGKKLGAPHNGSGDCPAKDLRLAQPQNPNGAGSFRLASKRSRLDSSAQTELAR